MKKIYLCAISNISSGGCLEDCGFCTQSIKYKTNIKRYKQKSIDDIVLDAKQAKANKAYGFCLVTSGKGLDDKKLDFVIKTALTIKKEVNDLCLIACNGIASNEQLKELKKAKVDAYNHNLETSKSYYPKICQTHSWEDRFQTCQNVNKVGLKLISGGIFGMGEDKEDRLELLNSIAILNPFSVALNFFHPNPALLIKANSLKNEDEALDIIKLARNILPKQTRVMVAGGREYMFKTKEKYIFDAGANSIVIGNYLTTSGNKPSRDFLLMKNAGYKIAEKHSE